MIQTASNLVIGVDGGGSHCRLALEGGGQRVEVRQGAANVSTDLEGALSRLTQGLETLAESAGLRLRDLAGAPAYLGLAGVVGPAMAAEISARLPLRHAVVDHDRIAAVAGALGAGDGAVIGIGTGSFLGRRMAGRLELIGGWGFVLGDEASGAVLGRELLSRALRAADGLDPGSDLTDAILSELGGTEGTVSFATQALPVGFARFAPRIVAAAKAGDRVASDLMAEGAAYIVAGLHGLGWMPGERVCPIGGLAPEYAAFLPDDLSRCLSEPEGSALDGALSLARALPTGGGPVDGGTA